MIVKAPRIFLRGDTLFYKTPSITFCNKATMRSLLPYFGSRPIPMCTHTGFSYCHPGISSKLDAKSAILSESLDSFSWGTWCHPSDELQPAAWQANPAKAINYFEQFAHQLHSARRPTLFSFLCPGSYHHPPPSAPRHYVRIRTPTRAYIHAHKNARSVAPMRGTLHAYIADTEKIHTYMHRHAS